MKKKLLKISFKILIATSLLAWFLYKSDVAKILENILSLPVNILFYALAVNFIYLIIKSFRWKLLLPQYPLKKLVELSFISQFYSVISAGQFVGEAAKIYILGKGQKDAGQIAMSVFIDKITGIIGLIIVAVFGLALTPTILPKSLSFSFIAAAALCLISIFLIRLPFIYNFLLNLLSGWHDRAAKFKRPLALAARLLEAWYLYSKKTRIIFLSVILSIIFQIVLLAVYMILSYGLNIKISFLDWCWLLGVLSGLLVLPITIGGLGVREGTLVGLLGFFLVAPEKALALSFSIFAVQLVFALIGGIVETRRAKVFLVN